MYRSDSWLAVNKASTCLLIARTYFPKTPFIKFTKIDIQHEIISEDDLLFFNFFHEPWIYCSADLKEPTSRYIGWPFDQFLCLWFVQSVICLRVTKLHFLDLDFFQYLCLNFTKHFGKKNVLFYIWYRRIRNGIVLSIKN